MKLSEQVRLGIQQNTKECVIEFGNKEVFLNYLIMMYQVIIASEDLIIAAYTASRNSGNDVLANYLLSHLDEEKNHAAWLAEDIAEAGIDVYEIPINKRIAEIVGSQYYLINHVSPLSFLGYMAVLEGNPLPIDRLEAWEALHGKQMVRTVRHHATHDVDHSNELFEIIDQVGDFRTLENAIQVTYYMNEIAEALEGML